MGYTACEWDIFISYARADDVAVASEKGWVERLYEELSKLLPQQLGGGSPTIFFDRNSSASNHQLDRLVTAARNAAVFLAIASDSYAARDWTRKELDAFVAHNRWNDGDETRLFAVECREPENRTRFPHPLDNAMARPMWKRLGKTTLPLQPEDREYSDHLYLLVDEIARKLREIRADEGRRATSPAAGPVPPSARHSGERSGGHPEGHDVARGVLLAQVTEDLDEQREQVRSYLAQFEIPVLPAEDYPQGGDAFRAAFAADLERADLFVQLLSERPGRKPRDLPEGYAQFQAAAASAKGIEIMQWRSPELRLDSVTDAGHRALLSGEHVIADSLESFKAAVRKAQERKAASPAQARRSLSSSFVFIDAAEDDLEAARVIAEELKRESFGAALPILEGPPTELRADLEENIINCRALVVVYGQTTPLWVRGHLRLYNKLKESRREPPRVLELWLEPPEDKKDHDFWLSELKRIRVSTPLSKQSLQPLIEALAE